MGVVGRGEPPDLEVLCPVGSGGTTPSGSASWKQHAEGAQGDGGVLADAGSAAGDVANDPVTAFGDQRERSDHVTGGPQFVDETCFGGEPTSGAERGVVEGEDRWLVGTGLATKEHGHSVAADPAASKGIRRGQPEPFVVVILNVRSR